MKTIAIAVFALTIPIASYALDNFKKEKKALTEAIRNNFDLWSIGYNEELSVGERNSLSQKEVMRNEVGDNEETNKEELVISASVKRKNSLKPHNFSNFEFTIVNNQAIVQFKVDHQLVSAFLEKANGRWNLVCAASSTSPQIVKIACLRSL